LIDDTALGDYQIVRPLGRGGMGLVFLGHDRCSTGPWRSS
jgi:serine/threonine protein kinase